MKTGLSINSKQTAGLPRLFLTLFVFLIPTSSLVTFGPINVLSFTALVLIVPYHTTQIPLGSYMWRSKIRTTPISLLILLMCVYFTTQRNTEISIIIKMC